MAKSESLREYQDSILKKMAAARSNEVLYSKTYFGFKASKRNFLVPGEDILEMVAPSKLEPIPASKPWLVGAANIKGSVYTVTDFSILIGGDPIKNGKFIILSSHIMPGSAVLVDSMTELNDTQTIGISIHDDGMKNMPKWISSCHEFAGERHYLLDASLLASDPGFSKLQRGEI